MAVERNTPQLVKKGKGKKRPGYRGPGEYQGGRGYGGSKSTSSSKSSNTGTGNRPNPHTSSGTSKTTTVSGDRMRSSAREWEQQLNQDNARRAAQTGQKFTPYKGGARTSSTYKGGGINGLIRLLIGSLHPAAGLLMGGFDRLKGGLGSLTGNINEALGDFREKRTGFRTQQEWEDARTQRQQQKRLDKLFAAKDRGYNQIGFGDFTKKTVDFTPGQQAKIDDLLAQGYTPSTARNVLTGRDLKGFTPSRMGLQTQITPMAKPTFSDPFANTVGTTTQINNPQNTGIEGIDVGYPSNDLMAELTKMQQKMLSGPQKNLRNIMGISDQEILDNISPFNDPEDPATLEEVQTFYGADGGLASMFTRRG